MKKPSSSSSKPKTAPKKSVRKPARRKVVKMEASPAVEAQSFIEVADASVLPVTIAEPAPARIVTMEPVPRAAASAGSLNQETKKVILWGSVAFVMLSIIVGWGATFVASLSVSTNTQNDEALTKANEDFNNLFIGVNQRLDSFSVPKTAATTPPTAEQSSTAPSLTADQIEALKEKVLEAPANASGNP